MRNPTGLFTDVTFLNDDQLLLLLYRAATFGIIITFDNTVSLTTHYKLGS